MTIRIFEAKSVDDLEDQVSSWFDDKEENDPITVVDVKFYLTEQYSSITFYYVLTFKFNLVAVEESSQ